MIVPLQTSQLLNSAQSGFLLPGEEAVLQDEPGLSLLFEEPELDLEGSDLLDDTAADLTVRWGMASLAEREVTRAPLSRAPRRARVVAAKEPAALAQPVEQSAARFLTVVRPVSQARALLPDHTASLPDVTELLEPMSLLTVTEDGTEVWGFASDQMPVAEAVAEQGPQVLTKPKSRLRTVAQTAMRAAAAITVGAIGMAMTAGEAAARIIKENPYKVSVDDMAPVVEKVGFGESIAASILPFWESLGYTGHHLVGGVALIFSLYVFSKRIYPRYLDWKLQRFISKPPKPETLSFRDRLAVILIKDTAKVALELGLSLATGSATDPATITKPESWEKRAENALVADLPALAAMAFHPEALGIDDTHSRETDLLGALAKLALHAPIFADPRQFADADKRKEAIDGARGAINTLQEIRSEMDSDGEGSGSGSGSGTGSGGGSAPTPTEPHPVLKAMGQHLDRLEWGHDALASMKEIESELEAVTYDMGQSFVVSGQVETVHFRIQEQIFAYMQNPDGAESLQNHLVLLSRMLHAVVLDGSEDPEALNPAMDRVGQLYQDLADQSLPPESELAGRRMVIEIVAGHAPELRAILQSSVLEPFRVTQDYTALQGLLADDAAVDGIIQRINRMLTGHAADEFGDTVYHDVYVSLINLEQRLLSFSYEVTQCDELLDGDSSEAGAQEIVRLAGRINESIAQIQVLQAFVAANFDAEMRGNSVASPLVPAPTIAPLPETTPDALHAMSAGELFHHSLIQRSRDLLQGRGGDDIQRGFLSRSLQEVYRGLLPLILSPASDEAYVDALERFVRVYPALQKARRHFISSLGSGATGIDETDVFLQELYERARTFLQYRRYTQLMRNTVVGFDNIETHVTAYPEDFSHTVVLGRLNHIAREFERVTGSQDLAFEDLSVLQEDLQTVVEAFDDYEVAAPAEDRFEQILTALIMVYDNAFAGLVDMDDLEEDDEAPDPTATIVVNLRGFGDVSIPPK